MGYSYLVPVSQIRKVLDLVVCISDLIDAQIHTYYIIDIYLRKKDTYAIISALRAG